MTHTPNSSISVDFAAGAVASGGTRQSVLAAETLTLLLKSAREEVRAEAGRAIGTTVGSNAKASLAGAQLNADAAGPEQVLNHLAGEFALHGYGMLKLERWGQALLCKVENAPVEDDVFLGNMVGAAFSQLLDNTKVEIATLAKCTYFLGSAETTKRARDLARLEKNYGVVAARIQGGR
jgi:hypothetical protein